MHIVVLRNNTNVHYEEYHYRGRQNSSDVKRNVVYV